MINLQDLLIPSKEITAEFPGCEGFEVTLCYLAREELVKIRKGCIITRLNRKTRQPEEILDEDKFLDQYIQGVLKGWKGLKVKYLKELLLIDSGSLADEDEIPFNLDNARVLMKNSVVFEGWVSDTTSELENFSGPKSEKSKPGLKP